MKLRNQQIKEILEKYSIGALKSKACVYNKWNTAYRLKTTTGDFLLKFLNFQSEKELLKELKIIDALKETLPCHLPVLSKNKKYYVEYHDSIVVIKKFIKGKPVVRGEKLANKNLVQLGKYLATIHQVKNISNIPKRDLYSYLQKFFSKIDTSSQEYQVAKCALRLLKNHHFNPRNLPKGLLHADLHTENILVRNENIVAILDFEDSHIGSFVYDIGICIFDACWHNRQLSKERIKMLVRGYESIRKLSKKEKAHLRDSAILAGLYNLHFFIIKNGVNDKKNLSGHVMKKFLRLLL